MMFQHSSKDAENCTANFQLSGGFQPVTSNSSVENTFTLKKNTHQKLDCFVDSLPLQLAVLLEAGVYSDHFCRERRESVRESILLHTGDLLCSITALVRDSVLSCT